MKAKIKYWILVGSFRSWTELVYVTYLPRTDAINANAFNTFEKIEKQKVVNQLEVGVQISWHPVISLHSTEISESSNWKSMDASMIKCLLATDCCSICIILNGQLMNGDLSTFAKVAAASLKVISSSRQTRYSRLPAIIARIPHKSIRVRLNYIDRVTEGGCLSWTGGRREASDRSLSAVVDQSIGRTTCTPTRRGRWRRRCNYPDARIA